MVVEVLAGTCVVLLDGKEDAVDAGLLVGDAVDSSSKLFCGCLVGA